jgi:hypothetical protein
MTQTKRYFLILASACSLLLIPLIAMSFTQEVQWSLFDFVVMGILLMAVGTGLEIVLRKVSSPGRRLLWLSAVVFAGLLLWAELAVGIFGSPLAGS